MKEPCEYCKDSVNFLIVMPNAGRGHVSLYLLSDVLTLAHGDGEEYYIRKDLKINYCPMCGRKLSGTATCDSINHPSHYTSGTYEVIDVIEDWGLNYNLGNALKYIGRADHKGTAVQDLKKGIWYMQRDLQNREKQMSDECVPF